jgi:rhodanese-related sulfurtransferase
MRTVKPDTLWEWLHDGGEIVVADVRDGGPFARAHILAAASIPLAQIEVLAPVMVPRRSTRTVLVDDTGVLSSRAAGILEAHGYTDLWVLGGGQDAWEASGRQVFSGSGIISKAFGEMVEHDLDTPRIEAAELREWLSSGREMVLVDARPMAEFRTVSLPGGVDCPGAELVYRVPGLLSSPDTPVVVNCAGRTRSIIGAQSLRNAGIPNPVFALKNGTMGWQLAGFGAVSGSSEMVPEPGDGGRAAARALADAVRERHRVSVIDAGTLAAFLADPTRTTYVFDVRQADAFEKGHHPGSVHAAGGQLVQATDTYAAVRNARIVVVDEHMVQSVMTAHWLAQMGWEVHVLESSADLLTETGPHRIDPLVTPGDEVSRVTADQLAEWKDRGPCMVVDVGESYWYREGRIPGSFYSMRTRLDSSLTRFRYDERLVFCCSDGRFAPFAAADARRMGFDHVHALEGGRNAWRRAGHPTERIGEDTDDLVLSETDDMWYPPWARKEGVNEAIMQYLTWETGLLEPVSRETYITFTVRG